MNYDMEELIPLVKKLVKRYTSNESTSVSYEKARQLMEAILFCMDEFTKNLSQEPLIHSEELSGQEVFREQKLSPEQAYEAGYQLVVKTTRKALQLYQSIAEQFQFYRNRALSDTVIKGMPQFFQYYDALFFPQNQILTLDYPTLKTVEHLKGIDAIYQYLQYIQLEQEFLKSFSDEYIETCLLAYHEDYEELFINIPSVVIRYTLRKMGEEEWQEKRQDSRENLEVWLAGMLRVLLHSRHMDNPEMFTYLQEDIKEFSYII